MQHVSECVIPQHRESRNALWDLDGQHAQLQSAQDALQDPAVLCRLSFSEDPTVRSSLLANPRCPLCARTRLETVVTMEPSANADSQEEHQTAEDSVRQQSDDDNSPGLTTMSEVAPGYLANALCVVHESLRGRVDSLDQIAQRLYDLNWTLLTSEQIEAAMDERKPWFTRIEGGWTAGHEERLPVGADLWAQQIAQYQQLWGAHEPVNLNGLQLRNHRKALGEYRDESGVTIPQQRTLPAIAYRVGGALESVLNDITAYVDDRFPLSPVQEIMISRIVEQRKELNNFFDLSLLVDAISYFGISPRHQKTFLRYLEESSMWSVHSALQYLYDHGSRNRGESLRWLGWALDQQSREADVEDYSTDVEDYSTDVEDYSTDIEDSWVSDD